MGKKVDNSESMPGVEDLPGLISRLEKVAIRLETSTRAQTFTSPDTVSKFALNLTQFLLKKGYPTVLFFVKNVSIITFDRLHKFCKEICANYLQTTR